MHYVETKENPLCVTAYLVEINFAGKLSNKDTSLPRQFLFSSSSSFSIECVIIDDNHCTTFIMKPTILEDSRITARKLFLQESACFVFIVSFQTTLLARQIKLFLIKSLINIIIKIPTQ